MMDNWVAVGAYGGLDVDVVYGYAEGEESIWRWLDPVSCQSIEFLYAGASVSQSVNLVAQSTNP